MPKKHIKGSVCGIGINDANYKVIIKSELPKVGGKRKRLTVWTCPYYMKWQNMLSRITLYGSDENKPTYKNCKICDEWKYFSNFKRWVDEQPNRDWQTCHLDKDLLVDGNKLYSPETCVFVDAKINSFIVHRDALRGECLLGVDIHKGKYRAKVRYPDKKHAVHIGLFSTELTAHKAWQRRKHELACILADQQTDQRVAQALRERYAPDKDWTNR
jgi:hypothetical protein